jgi:hypothetical protein
MKKLSIVLLTVFLLTGCDQINDLISYFVDIEPSKTTGTENTEFVFKANSNDTVAQWDIDGAIIPTEKNELSYSFSSGDHTVSVLTSTGAEDSINISVSPVETIFKISAVTREDTTEIYLDYPLLTINETEYNIETTGLLNITETETQRIISLNIEVEQSDNFVFINNNAQEIYGIDLQNVTISQMNELIMMWFPERYEELEPEIPYYSETRFNLSGYQRAVSDHLTVFDEYIQIGGINYIYTESAVYVEEIRKIVLFMSIDSSDSFLFMNGNMQNFFNINLSDMSYSELIITADVLNRYPTTGILDLKADYNP